jgi:hypothetical protein
VRYGHELGQCGAAKDGMVCGVEVSHQEVDVVDAKVFGGAELYR